MRVLSADNPVTEIYRGTEGKQASPALRLAYLTSRYPAVSHAFIYREIAEFRERGSEVDASSVNVPDLRSNGLQDDEREESRSVFYIRQTSVVGILQAHFRTLLRRPRGFFRGLRTAVRHGRYSRGQLTAWIGYFGEAVILGDRLARRGFRHLHVHFATEVANVGYLASGIFDLEYSMTVHGPDEFYDVRRYILAEKVRGATMVCCISDFARSQLMKLTAPDQWRKLHVAPVGVDIKAFPPQPFRVSPKTFEVLCVGRLTPAKGQHILLAAVAELCSRGYCVRLRLAGDGPSRKSLQAWCRRRNLSPLVIFEGAVDRGRIRECIAKADVFVLASFAEGIPVALIEAMASEVACVSSRIAGIPELIRDGIDGLLVAPSNVGSLAEAIASLIDDPVYRRRIGKAGRERVATEFDVHRSVTRLHDLFGQHIKAHRRACHETS